MILFRIQQIPLIYNTDHITGKDEGDGHHDRDYQGFAMKIYALPGRLMERIYKA